MRLQGNIMKIKAKGIGGGGAGGEDGATSASSNS